MRGAPKLLSSTTLRPLGPSVTFTALLRISTPRNILSRASTENLTSLAAIDVLHWICGHPETPPRPIAGASPRACFRGQRAQTPAMGPGGRLAVDDKHF